MITILKKLRNLPMLGLVAAAAVLSVVLGCGGRSVDPTSNSIVINAATNASEPIGTFAMTIRNASTRNLSAVSYTVASSELDSTETRVLTLTPVVQRLNPEIFPNGTVAAQVSYNIPASGEAMTIAITIHDASGGSQGFNLIISRSAQGTVITPEDGNFVYN